MIAACRWLLLAMPFAGCVVRPVDPFFAAERAMAKHELSGALQALDAVPVTHARYPEARALAIDVERDMRRCHEWMLEAMLLRSEWRDTEALVVLEKVRGLWPGMPGADVLAAATEQRRRLFATVGTPTVGSEAAQSVKQKTEGEGQPAPAPTPALEHEEASSQAAAPPRLPPSTPPALEAEPAAPSRDEVALAPAAPAVESAPAAPAVASAPPASRSATTSAGDDAVALGLMAVEQRLVHGQLEAALVDLMEMARRSPADLRVRNRLLRLLHQRALLRYGDGFVDLAIADWQRVLELDTGHRAARRMLDAAVAAHR